MIADGVGEIDKDVSKLSNVFSVFVFLTSELFPNFVFVGISHNHDTIHHPEFSCFDGIGPVPVDHGIIVCKLLVQPNKPSEGCTASRSDVNNCSGLVFLGWFARLSQPQCEGSRLVLDRIGAKGNTTKIIISGLSPHFPFGKSAGRVDRKRRQ